MLNLSSVTLVCIDCVEVDRAIKAMERCKMLCSFGAVKLLTSLPTDYEHKIEIQHLPTLVHYSLFCIKKLYKYIDTEHLLIVQHDGWVLNPQTWDNSWLQCDYIGPLFNDRDVNGVGGFTFRSRAIMEAISKLYPEWIETDEETESLQKHIGFWDDGALSIGMKPQLEEMGFKYAPLEIAGMFAQGGNPNPQYHFSYPFGFHGSWRTINQETGYVDSKIKYDGVYPKPLL